MKRQFGFLKTTALGGVLFLLPLIVIGALVGQAVPIVMAIAQFLGTIIPVRTPTGIAFIIALAVTCCLLLCFGAGVIARLSLGRRFSGWVERNVLLLFPRYAIVRDQMAGTVGESIVQSTLTPVIVTFDDHQVLAFEVDRASPLFAESASDPTTSKVTIYLPGAPDPWSGQVVFVDSHRVAPANIEFGAAIDTCKRLGRRAT